MTEEKEKNQQAAGEVSSKGTPSGEEAKASQTQSLSDERLQEYQKYIDQAVEKALKQGRELGKREIQSVKDKEVARAQREVRKAERALKAYESLDLDEETRNKATLARYQAEKSVDQSFEEEEKVRQQGEAYHQSILEHLEELGIKPDDSRLDWAQDASTDAVTGRRRFDASVAKIVKQEQEKREKTMEQDMKKQFALLETEFRKKYGFDSEKAEGGGAPSSDDAFIKEFAEGKSNDLKRAVEIKNRRK